MKLLILVSSLILSPFAFAYSADAVKAAEELYTVVQDRFAVGEVTRVDVGQAESFVFEMKYQAGVISKADYCKHLITARRMVLTGVKAEEKVGQRTIEDVIRAELEYHKAVAHCK